MPLQAAEIYFNVCFEFDTNDISEPGLGICRAAEIRCFNLTGVRYYCFGVKKPQREIHVVSRRAHRDRNALCGSIGSRCCANLDFQRLLDSDVIFNRDLLVCIHFADVDCQTAGTHR